MRQIFGPLLLILSFVGILYAMKLVLGEDVIAGGLLFLAAFNMGLVGSDMTMLGLEKSADQVDQ